MDSILTSIKKMLGVDESYTSFDTDIVININSVFGILNQLGVGPAIGFSISDASAEWVDFTQDNIKLEMIKTYIYLKVKLIFDPPTTGSVMEATRQLISELEWRIRAGSECE